MSTIKYWITDNINKINKDNYHPGDTAADKLNFIAVLKAVGPDCVVKTNGKKWYHSDTETILNNQDMILKRSYRWQDHPTFRVVPTFTPAEKDTSDEIGNVVDRFPFIKRTVSSYIEDAPPSTKAKLFRKYFFANEHKYTVIDGLLLKHPDIPKFSKIENVLRYKGTAKNRVEFYTLTQEFDGFKAGAVVCLFKGNDFYDNTKHGYCLEIFSVTETVREVVVSLRQVADRVTAVTINGIAKKVDSNYDALKAVHDAILAQCELSAVKKPTFDGAPPMRHEQPF